MRILLFAFYYLSLNCLVSCVGTVEDLDPASTKGINVGGSDIAFDGIYDVEVIANDKVEIYFYPSQLDARDVTYVISYDGLSIPKAVPGASLRPDYRGLLKYVLTGLDTNREYTFVVQAKDESGTESNSTLVKKARTFSNQTANFLGIGDVKNLPGFDGRTALKVEWPAAERIGSIFVPKEQDPIQYEITLLDSDVVTPVAFDDDVFEEPTRKVVFVGGEKISHQVNGLQPDTKYFVRVRAIHSGMNDYGADPSYSAEQNNTYILASTLSDDISSLEVEQDSFEVEIPSGGAGLYSLSTKWKAAEGSIDHYRVYYKKSSEGSAWSFYKSSRDEICSGPEVSDSSWNCTSISFEKESFTIADLTPFTDYDINLIACATRNCEAGNFVEYNSSPPYKTNPGHASFGGITEIIGAKYYWSLNEYYLQLTPPDFNSGVADGILVELKERSTGPSVDTFLNHPDNPSGLDISVANFDYRAATEITISGIDLNETVPYCFELVPYYYDNGVIVENRNNPVTRCKLPQLEVPTLEDFTGLDGAVLDSSTSTVNLTWSAPLQGVYEGYRLYVRIDGGTFNFSDATSGDANYMSIDIPYGQTSYQAPFLANGNYTFGILTYYTSDGTELFSEANTNTQTITVGP
ncbi:fibronectin type III domain-containing protein [Halobacteriovorax sp.]|uniref:fibronectin type III domain-containing protein n=1 Tax=Halobacteriovorax sp. TaxID=2020862 RepID=UPI0035626C28